MTESGSFTIGRNPSNDLVVRNSQVSGKHAVLKKTADGLVILDLDSRNGILVNGKRVKSAVVSPGDTVMLSSGYRLDWANRSLLGWLSGGQVTAIGSHPVDSSTREWQFCLEEYKSEQLSIGRDEACDITVEHPRVSRVHATILRDGMNWIIEDNKSANGTYVNGVRVKKATIRPGTHVALAGIPLQLFPEKRRKADAVPAGEASIEVENLSFAVPFGQGSKLLLRDISISIPPGSFVGLIGPSGSGKTTLMQCINGSTTPTMGSVTINGIDVHCNRNLFKGFIGYVPQDDIIHRELTVGSSLNYNADLRLPEISKQERRREVERVLKELSLTGTEDTLIGSPLKKGISGGQRKRVNLAQELITRPSILFLDEPCSGLDPKSDMDVMVLLRELCDAGKTVLLTTHNPSQRNLDLMDYLLVLTYGGRLAYFGPADEVSRYFGVTYPEDVFTKLDEKPPEHWESKHRTTGRHRIIIPAESATGKDPPSEPDAAFSGQLRTLCRRLACIKARDSLNTMILLAVPVMIGVLLALIMSPIEAEGLMAPRIRTVYNLVVAATFFGVLNSARDVVAERAIYRREAGVFLKDGSYVLSKVLVLGALCAVQCLLMLAITYPACGLKGSFASYFFILLSVGLGGTAIGLMVSSMVSTETVAMTFVPAVLVPQIILGGYVVRFNEMTEPVKILAGTALSRWGFEAALLEDSRHFIEADNLAFSDTVASMIGFTEGNTMVDMLAIGVWFSLFYLMTLFNLQKTR